MFLELSMYLVKIKPIEFEIFPSPVLQILGTQVVILSKSFSIFNILNTTYLFSTYTNAHFEWNLILSTMRASFVVILFCFHKFMKIL